MILNISSQLNQEFDTLAGRSRGECWTHLCSSFPQILCKKNSLSLNMYTIPIWSIFFIIAIVAVMKSNCEGSKFFGGRMPVSSDLKSFYFFSRLQFQILDYSSGFEIIWYSVSLYLSHLQRQWFLCQTPNNGVWFKYGTSRRRSA